MTKAAQKAVIVFGIAVLMPWIGISAIPIALVIQKSTKVITLIFILSLRYPGPWLRRFLTGSLRMLHCEFGLVLRWLRFSRWLGDYEVKRSTADSHFRWA